MKHGIAIAPTRGGTGRTTTAVTLAHGLALAGHAVTLVDCDPLRSVARHFDIPADPGLASLLRGGAARAFEVRRSLRIVDSGGASLADLDPHLATPERLRRALDEIEAEFVLLDLPPGPANLSRHAIALCDTVLLPFGADHLGLESLRAALEAQPDPERSAVLATFYDPAASPGEAWDAALAACAPARVLQTRIRYSAALRLAPAGHGTVFDTDPLSDAALDFARLTEEIAARV